MTEPQSIPIHFNVNLTALIHPEPLVGGFSAEIPALPGCYTQGETLEEVQANLREAAEGWLAAAHDHALSQTGQPLGSIKKEEHTSPSKAGSYKKAEFWMAPDFNAPLEDFKEYME